MDRNGNRGTEKAAERKEIIDTIKKNRKKRKEDTGTSTDRKQRRVKAERICRGREQA